MKINRRLFIKKSLSAVAGIPLLSSLNSCDFMDKLPFSGTIVGEDFHLGHLLRDQQFKFSIEPKGDIVSCIIVGGGCSGISAGWKLFQNGIKDFVVLEKDKQSGGTAQSGKIGELDFPWGAHYIETPTEEGKFLLPLYEDIGVILGYYDNGWPIVNSEFVVKDPEVQLYTSKGWTKNRFPYPLANDNEKAIFSSFQKKMSQFFMSKGSDGKPFFTLPIQESSTDRNLTLLDQMTMKDYMTQEGLRSPLLDWYVDMQCRDNFACYFHEISAWVALNYFSANYNRSNPIESKAKPVDILSWTEGNNFLIQAMSRMFLSNIRLNSMVVDIRQEKDLVLVTYFQTQEQRFVTLKAKTVILALPKFLVPKLIHNLSDEILQSFSHLEYAPWIVANILVNKAPSGKSTAWDNISYSDWSLGYIYNNFLDYRLKNKHSQPTVLTFYAPLLKDGINNERSNLLRQNWDYWVNRIISDLFLMHPNLIDSIERLDIFKWGHAMIRPIPNYVWGKEREVISKPIANIFPAHCDVGGLPIFEQAVYSSFKAVDSVLLKLI